MEQAKFSEFLYKQVSLGVGLVALAFAIYFVFANPQQELQLTAAKLEGRIEAMEKNNTRLESKVDEMNKSVQDLIKQVASLQGALSKR